MPDSIRYPVAYMPENRLDSAKGCAFQLGKLHKGAWVKPGMTKKPIAWWILPHFEDLKHAPNAVIGP